MSPNTRSFVRDLAGDLLYATGITQPSKRIKDHPFSIVTFHRVLPAELLKSYPINGIAVTPSEFEWFVKIFKKHYLTADIIGMVNNSLKVELSMDNEKKTAFDFKISK